MTAWLKTISACFIVQDLCQICIKRLNRSDQEISQIQSDNERRYQHSVSTFYWIFIDKNPCLSLEMFFFLQSEILTKASCAIFQLFIFLF